MTTKQRLEHALARLRGEPRSEDRRQGERRSAIVQAGPLPEERRCGFDRRQAQRRAS